MKCSICSFQQPLTGLFFVLVDHTSQNLANFGAKYAQRMGERIWSVFQHELFQSTRKTLCFLFCWKEQGSISFYLDLAWILHVQCTKNSYGHWMMEPKLASFGWAGRKGMRRHVRCGRFCILRIWWRELASVHIGRNRGSTSAPAPYLKRCQNAPTGMVTAETGGSSSRIWAIHRWANLFADLLDLSSYCFLKQWETLLSNCADRLKFSFWENTGRLVPSFINSPH